MSLGFLSRVRASGTALVCDIGSGSVGIAIIDLTTGQETATVRQAQRDVLSQEERDPAHLMQALISQFSQTLTTVLEKHHAAQGGRIHSATLVLHTPWSSTRTGLGKLMSQKPTRITAHVVEQTTHKALESLPAAEGDVIEQTAIRFELNGYPTAQPVGKIARSTEAIVLQSVAQSSLVQALSQEIMRQIPDCTVSTRSHILVDLSAIREAMGTIEDFVILDVGSESSSFTVIREGMLQRTGEIEFGSRAIMRSVATSMGSTPEEVLSLLRMMLDGSSSPRAADKVNTALADIEKGLVGIFGKAFTSGDAAARLPDTLFASVPPELVVWLKGFLERIDFGQFTIVGRPFNVIHLVGDHFGVRVHMPADMHADATLAADIAFVTSKS